jgi:hypothetical protein
MEAVSSTYLEAKERGKATVDVLHSKAASFSKVTATVFHQTGVKTSNAMNIPVAKHKNRTG